MQGFHALLIGINEYDGRVRSLHGCINDIDAIQQILIRDLCVDPKQIIRLVSPRSPVPREDGVEERLATHDNIREALESLGSDAVSPGDRVFIYYSGHGTNKKVSGRGGTHHTREALVPKDYGLNGRLLYDCKLNQWLAAIAGRTSSVTFVIDACCSSGVTRDLEEPRTASRYLDTRTMLAVPDDEEVPEPGQTRRLVQGIVGEVETCQVVAACLGDERARESPDWDDVCHGDLTRALVRELGSLGPDAMAQVRWGRIWPGIKAHVHKRNPAQTPWISENYSRRLVFAGPPEHGDLGYSVTKEKDGTRYRLAVGELSGITRGAQLAIYGAQPARLPPLGSAEDAALDPHIIVVESAEPAAALAVAKGAKEGAFELPPGARARLVKAGRPARLNVKVTPRAEDIERRLRASGLVHVVEPAEPHDLEVLRLDDGSWSLVDSVFGPWGNPHEPWLVRIPAEHRDSIVAVTEHYFHYIQPLKLAQRCNDLSDLLRVSVRDASTIPALAEAQDIDRFPERPRGRSGAYDVHAAPTAVPICIGVRNDSSVNLVVTLMLCNNSGRVIVMAPTAIPATRAHIFWGSANVAKPIWVTPLGERPVSLDRIIAIGTTDRCASLDHLDRRRSSFESIVRTHRGEREMGLEDELVPVRDQWTSDVAVLRVLAPGEG